MTICIECSNNKDADAIFHEITRQPETVGFSPEYLQRMGATYTIFENYKALLATRAKVKKNTLIFDVDVMFDKKMSLVDFLTKNPAIRDTAIVKMYFTEDVLDKAIKMGAINLHKGKIVL